MTDIRFYHLTTQTIDQALPAILAKALSGGHRVLVKLADVAQVDQINDVLWTYRADSFLPHGTAKEGYGDQQPIWITAGDDHPHFVCQTCGVVECLPEESVTLKTTRSAARVGRVIEILLKGRCVACA
jgi:DNA polymerase IIIc chi subunit